MHTLRAEALEAGEPEAARRALSRGLERTTLIASLCSVLLSLSLFPAAAPRALGGNLRQRLRRGGGHLGLLGSRRARRHRAHPHGPDARDARDHARRPRRAGERALLARARLRPLRRPQLVGDADRCARPCRATSRSASISVGRAGAAAAPCSRSRARSSPRACSSRPACRPPFAARSAGSSATRIGALYAPAAAGKRVLYHVVSELSEPPEHELARRPGRGAEPRRPLPPAAAPRSPRRGARARDRRRPAERRRPRARRRALAAPARPLHDDSPPDFGAPDSPVEALPARAHRGPLRVLRPRDGRCCSRSVGLPARLVNGFAGGHSERARPTSSRSPVRRAHLGRGAIPEAGWVRYDPTPPDLRLAGAEALLGGDALERARERARVLVVPQRGRLRPRPPGAARCARSGSRGIAGGTRSRPAGARRRKTPLAPAPDAPLWGRAAR